MNDNDNETVIVDQPEYTIYEVTSYKWKCNECHEGGASRYAKDAQKGAHDHANFHASSKFIGKTLAGEVCTRHNSDAPVIGHISAMIDYAKENNWPFFEFNGYVYPTSITNLNQRLCYIKDVPDE